MTAASQAPRGTDRLVRRLVWAAVVGLAASLLALGLAFYGPAPGPGGYAASTRQPS